MSLNLQLSPLTLPEGTELAKLTPMQRFRIRHRDRLRSQDREKRKMDNERAKTDPVFAEELRLKRKKKNDARRHRSRAYYLANKEKAAARANKRYLAIKADPVKWRARLERQKPRVQEWRKKNPEKLKESVLAWHKTERGRTLTNAAKLRAKKRRPELHMKIKLRNRMRNALALQGISGKCDKTKSLLGCDPIQLRKHLESLFVSGMSWENRSEWEIDHIRPCASFNLLDPEQQRCCFHYTNLQPLWREDNRKKADKWLA